MKKHFDISTTNLFTAFIFIFLILDSIFYQGFSQKHFFINPHYFLIFYFFLIISLFVFEKISISKKIIKLNKIFFPILISLSILFFLIEQYTYPNFIYGHIHINPNNFVYLVFLSTFIFYIYDYRKIKKHFYLIIPLICVFFTKRLSFGINPNFELTSEFTKILINYILWLTILLFFISIFKKHSNSIVGFLIFFFLFNLTNYYKIKSWNQPITFGDIYTVGNFKEFIGGFLSSNKTLSQVLISLITISFFIFIIKKIFNQKNPKLNLRIIIGIISIIIISIPIVSPKTINNITSVLKIKSNLSNPLIYCKNNGILFCFYNDLQNIKNPTPENYNQKTIDEIYSNLSENKQIINKNDNLKPNIVVILSEALFDVTKLPNIKLSQDPIINIRQDQKSTLISPQFGGGTANIEFEIITGLSNYLMKGKVPYSQAIYKDLPTIFSLFKNKGYTTTTIHPYLRSMFNRSSVYKHFGVDKFITIEDMSSYDKTGPYVSDKSFTQEILKQFNSTSDPQLIFTLSMQNHFPFEVHRFDNNPIQITSSLKQEDHNSLETYINGIYYSDQSYLFLKEELKKSSKPTIVIFYGDHLPLLNTDFGIYKSLNFVPQDQSSWTTSDYKKMYTTPISVWSNYETNIQVSSPSITPNFLSLEILNLANIKPEYQFKFIDSISQTDTILSQDFTPKFSSKELSDYNLIQYDLLFGKQYGIK